MYQNFRLVTVYNEMFRPGDESL